MKNLFIYGATGQAIVLEEILKYQGYKTICAFDKDIHAKYSLVGTPIFNERKKLQEFLLQFDKINYVIAIGGGNGYERLKLQNEFKELGLNPLIVVHPHSYISSSAQIGEGSQILVGAIVGVKSVLGKSVIINTKASIDHECIVGDGCHIGPGVTMAGCVTVAENTFIGVGAVVKPRVKIGKNVIIGAGAVVVSDIPDDVICYGVPARVMKSNLKG